MCEHEEQVIKQLDSSEDKKKYKPAYGQSELALEYFDKYIEKKESKVGSQDGNLLLCKLLKPAC